MAISKRHHYIPQFYLKGFTNESGEYYIFDKETETIRLSTPLNSFFENNRNTVIVKDERTVFLEDIYSKHDSETAPELEKIRSASKENFILDSKTLARLKLFINQIYWRVPENDEELEKKIDGLSFKEAGFDFVNKKTGESLATSEFQEQLKNTEIFRQMYRVFVPMISAQKKYINNDYDNWKVYFHKEKLHLTGDNPLIIKKFVDYSSLNKELLFPISSDKLLVHTDNPKPQSIQPKFLLELDMLILQQATRLVCCPDKTYLEYLIKNLYPYSKGHDFTDQMKESVFNYFK